MKKSLTMFLLLWLAAIFSGCTTLGITTPNNFVTPGGAVIETSEEMAIIMAVRDSGVERDKAFSKAMADSTGEGQRIALTAAYFGKNSPKYERSKTWDERLLPWASGIFMPIYLAEKAGSKSGKNGISVDGDGNTVYYSEDTLDNQSYKNTWVTPISTKTTQAQLNTGGGTGGSNNTGDQSKTEKAEPAAEEATE
jgi:hypothetical protein